MRLWTGKAFMQAAGGELRGVLPQQISGISIDSRSLQKGDAFFAVKGERMDGHDYAAAAAAAGAALLVVEAAKLKDLPVLPVPLLAVNNIMTALENLARAARARLAPGAKVAAITGSVGKTTVKEMLARVLARFGKVHFSPASFNNHFGVPLTLARMPADTDFAVYEIGMSHAGEITPLVGMVRPHLALITRIAAAHMGHFNSLGDIAAAKAEIFSGLEPDGAVLLNKDDAQYEFLADKARAAEQHKIYSFGRTAAADYRLAEEQSFADIQNFTLEYKGEKIDDFEVAATGSHMAENACAALAAFSLLAIGGKQRSEVTGVWHYAAEALRGFKAGAGRGARHRLALPHKTAAEGSFMLIDESYNANPLSMRRALELLKASETGAAGRRIAVLGDMLELGAGAQRAHEALAEKLAAANVDILFLIGANMRFLRDKLQQENADKKPELHWREKAEDAIPLLEKTLQAGDSLMVKSSNSVGTGRLVKALLAECGQVE